MQLTPKQFKAAAEEVVNSGLRQFVWGVFDNYVIRKEGSSQDTYVYAPRKLPKGRRLYDLLINPYLRDPWTREQGLYMYSPLVDTPKLFLEFASLPDDPGLDEDLNTKHNKTVWLDWVHAYGVLGLTPPMTSDPGADRMRQGGRVDTLSRFVREARYANAALRLYEAATAPEGPDTDFIQRGVPESRKDELAQSPTMAKEWALDRVALVVEAHVQEGCYPVLRRQEDGSFQQTFVFDNLLAAMWLQMMWLLMATGEIRRCARAGCNKIITYDQPPQPRVDPGLKKNARGKYKTRKDKQFCSTLCRVKNHQKNRRG
jgi:hypothetical protein